MLYDLSHWLEPAMPVFPGDPAVDFEVVEQQPPWRVTRLQLGSHSGTHIDAPLHYFGTGRPISDYPLERFILPAVVIPIETPVDNQPISASVLNPWQDRINSGIAVLFRTNWDSYFGTSRYEQHPYLSLELVAVLASCRVGLVGIDTLSVDSTVQGTDYAHRLLLGAEILIVENLRGLVWLVPGRLYGFAAIPLPLRGCDGAPVRAFAWDLSGPMSLSDLVARGTW